MRTVITHIYNEEFLLPWWLKHHTQIFDHGIVIDYGSTDNSVEICKKYAPNWSVVNSRNLEFDAVLCDFEVMNYEYHITGFKIALTVTEFLIGSKHTLDQFEKLSLGSYINGCMIPLVEMNDLYPGEIPSYDLPLQAQKFHGSFNSSGRLYHRAPVALYGLGRHNAYVSNIHASLDLLILKYSFSPWCKELIDRKLQIKDKRSKNDQIARNGIHHGYTLEQWEEKKALEIDKVKNYNKHIKLIENLNGDTNITNGDYYIKTFVDRFVYFNELTNFFLHDTFVSGNLNLILRINDNDAYFYCIDDNDIEHILNVGKQIKIDIIQDNKVSIILDESFYLMTDHYGIMNTTDTPTERTVFYLFKK